MDGAALALRGLAVALAGRRVVEDLHLDAPAGEVVGLVGPNGCGKSTTLRAVLRILGPAAGAVLVDGADVTTVPRAASARMTSAVLQDPPLDLDYTVRELVAMGRIPHQGPLDRESAHDRAVCDAALRAADAVHLVGRSVTTLSGGERQRVLVARALAGEPRLLVLDEPTNHLDVHHQLELLALVRRSRVTVLVALHDLNLAAAFCDRVHVLHSGRLAASGAPADVFTPALLAAVFGVRAHVVPHPASGVPQLLYDLPEDPPDVFELPEEP
ncbi:MAG TPA: ABC transporter ATP-binding protein [Actinomycetospora sp.]|nr:ABC transporter ATP-binding protein [Actinomycetospora sp.]